MIEVFMNDRQAANTWHDYAPEDQHVALYSKDGDIKVRSVTGWKMRSIYEGTTSANPDRLQSGGPSRE